MRKLLIAAGLLMAAATGAAFAQDHGPGGMLAAADTNHDGNITRAEFDQARAARFAQMDANHDGSLQASERPQWGGGDHPAGAAAPTGGSPPGGGGRGMRADTNGDGVISRTEYDAQGAAMFARLDADHNGTITQAEIDAMRAQHAAHQGQ